MRVRDHSLSDSASLVSYCRGPVSHDLALTEVVISVLTALGEIRGRAGQASRTAMDIDSHAQQGRYVGIALHNMIIRGRVQMHPQPHTAGQVRVASDTTASASDTTALCVIAPSDNLCVCVAVRVYSETSDVTNDIACALRLKRFQTLLQWAGAHGLSSWPPNGVYGAQSQWSQRLSQRNQACRDHGLGRSTFFNIVADVRAHTSIHTYVPSPSVLSNCRFVKAYVCCVCACVCVCVTTVSTSEWPIPSLLCRAPVQGPE